MTDFVNFWKAAFVAIGGWLIGEFHPHWREQRAALRARINELEGGEP